MVANSFGDKGFAASNSRSVERLYECRLLRLSSCLAIQFNLRSGFEPKNEPQTSRDEARGIREKTIDKRESNSMYRSISRHSLQPGTLCNSTTQTFLFLPEIANPLLTSLHIKMLIEIHNTAFQSDFLRDVQGVEEFNRDRKSYSA
jgi:hypothetical protein